MTAACHPSVYSRLDEGHPDTPELGTARLQYGLHTASRDGLESEVAKTWRTWSNRSPTHHSIADSAYRYAGSVVDDVLTLNDPTKHADPFRPISAASITFNLIQSTCGVGILSLATTFAYAGIIVAGTGFCLVAFVTYHSIRLLLDALLRTGTASYEALGECCFGIAGRRAVQASVLGVCATGLAAYLVSLKAFLWLVLQQIIPDSAWAEFTDSGGTKDTLLLAVVACVILPLSLSRRIEALARTSLIGIFCILYFVVLSVVFMFHYASIGNGGLHCHELDDDAKNVPTEDASLATSEVFRILSAFSIIGASFACQFTVFPVFREARVAEPERQAAKKISRSGAAAMFIVTPLYLLAALAGYSVWRQVVTKASTVLACYDTAAPAVAACYVGMTVTMVCAFPLVCFSARYTLATLVLGDDVDEISTPCHAAMTVAIVGSVTGVACSTDQLSVVLSIGSALSTPGVCYILPALCYLKALRLPPPADHSPGGDAGCSAAETPSSDSEDPEGAELLKYPAGAGIVAGGPAGGHVMLAFGVVCQVLMLLGAVLNLVL